MVAPFPLVYDRWSSWEDCNADLHRRYGFSDDVHWRPELDADLEGLRKEKENMDWCAQVWIDKLEAADNSTPFIEGISPFDT